MRVPCFNRYDNADKQEKYEEKKVPKAFGKKPKKVICVRVRIKRAA